MSIPEQNDKFHYYVTLPMGILLTTLLLFSFGLHQGVKLARNQAQEEIRLEKTNLDITLKKEAIKLGFAMHWRWKEQAEISFLQQVDLGEKIPASGLPEIIPAQGEISEPPMPVAKKKKN